MKPKTSAALDSLETMWAKMDRLQATIALAERPPNSFTTRDWSDRYGIPYSTAINQLKRKVRSGELTQHQVRLVDDAGVIRRTNVYTIA